MATYVPGYQRYERETKPFTPDYKFLSAVLDTRQDRFDTNYKQLNDQYSKVVYADMSREDTTNARDQYTQQLIPRMEKLSGMDLSIRQNVDSAKSLFKPFYEDDLIVKDLVFTSQYKKNMQLATILKDSDSADERKKYWTTGIQALNYQMKDFMSADRDTALKSGLPSYVENVDLEAMSMKILTDAGFKDVIMDLPVKEGDPFVIRQKNGSLQVPGAYNYLMKTLMEDPRVIEAYRTSGLVQARGHAETGVENGLYSNIAEGKNAWAQNTLNELRNRNAIANPILKQQFEKALEAKQNWERYEKEEGIIPDSDEHKDLLEAFEKFDNAEGILKRNEEALQRMDSVDENTDSLNFAYNMLMNYNLSSDILGAATSYSKRDYSQTIAMKNPYTKMKIQHQYDIARDDNASANKKSEAILQGKIDGNVNKKGEIINPAYLAAEIFNDDAGPDDFSTEYEDVELIKDPYKRNLEDVDTNAKVIAGQQADWINNFLTLKNSSKRVGDQNGNMTITLANNKKFTGNTQQIKQELIKPENVNVLAKLYSESFKEFTELPKTNRQALKSIEYVTLAADASEIAGRTDQILAWNSISKQQVKKNWEAAKSIGALPLGRALEKGVPSIVDDKGEVSDENEYVTNYVNSAKEGKIKGANYMVGRGGRMDDGSMRYEGALSIGEAVSRRIDKYTGDVIFDKTNATNDAKQAYKDQYKILNNTLNENYTARYDTKNTGLFQALSADAYFRNVPLDEMNAANLYTYGGTKTTFNVATITSDEKAFKQLKAFRNQFINTPSADKIIIPTGVSSANPDKETDPTADYILRQTLNDIQRAMLQPKSEASKKLLVGIEYRPVAGVSEDGTKYAGFKISLTDDQLKAFTSDAAKTPAGKLNNDAIKDYSEITMLYKQELDTNPLRAGQYNFSSTQTKIQLSEDNTYHYDMFKETAGSFRIFNKDDVYYRSMEMLQVDPKTGNFVLAGQQAIQPILNQNNQPVTINELDRYIANFEASFADLHTKNMVDVTRIKKQLGIK